MKDESQDTSQAANDRAKPPEDDKCGEPTSDKTQAISDGSVTVETKTKDEGQAGKQLALADDEADRDAEITSTTNILHVLGITRIAKRHTRIARKWKDSATRRCTKIASDGYEDTQKKGWRTCQSE